MFVPLLSEFPLETNDYRQKYDDLEDALLSEIGTSAAPYYLLPYYFENNSSKGSKAFNLVDRHVVAHTRVDFQLGYLRL